MYETGRNSTIRMITDVIATLQNTQYYDWDAHDDGELPDTDLIGLIGYAQNTEGEFHDITAGIGIVTQSDPGIYRLTGLVNHFYNLLGPTKKFPLYAGDGTEIGTVSLFDGTAVAPVARMLSRPAQTISFSGRMTLGSR